MAENKKSFIAYSDWKNIFDELPNEEAGKLIKHIFAYVNDENQTTDSILINAVFANIKTTLKRDLEKWQQQLNQRVEAGKKSAEVRLTKMNDRSTTVDVRRRNPTDNVSVNGTVNDNILLFERFWDLYDKKSDRSKCLIKFKKLKQTEIDKIFETLPNYIKSTPEVKFRKNPLTYLNGQCWNDEMLPIEEKKEFNILDHCKPTR